jgi:hypothetical protein
VTDYAEQLHLHLCSIIESRLSANEQSHLRKAKGMVLKLRYEAKHEPVRRLLTKTIRNHTRKHAS